MEPIDTPPGSRPTDAFDAPSARSPVAQLVEALLLAADRPLTAADIVQMVAEAVEDRDWPGPVTSEQIQDVLNRLRGSLSPNGGVELVEVGGGFRLRTPPVLAQMVRRLWPDRASRLSGAALEVLSIVAYRQPCTRIEVEDVRGVDCGGVLRALLERRLVRIVGKKDEPGRPLLYGTTTEFLETFSLPNLRSMPTLRDLEALRAEEEARVQNEHQMRMVLDLTEPESGQSSSAGASSSSQSASSSEPPEPADDA